MYFNVLHIKRIRLSHVAKISVNLSNFFEVILGELRILLQQMHCVIVEVWSHFSYGFFFHSFTFLGIK